MWLRHTQGVTKNHLDNSCFVVEEHVVPSAMVERCFSVHSASGLSVEPPVWRWFARALVQSLLDPAPVGLARPCIRFYGASVGPFHRWREDA